jgi:hypothetical protein
LGLSGRTTEDVDFVVQVNDWAQHHKLVDHALESGFEKRPEEHRLRHGATDTLIDLVPYGGLEDPEGTIRWPVSEHEMSVWGMQESQEHAVALEVAPGLRVRAVTLPCLVALKMFAWLDRRHTDKGESDLADANHILLHCGELAVYETLRWEAYERASEIAESVGRVEQLSFTGHTGAALVGGMLQSVLRPQTKSHLIPIVQPLGEDAWHPAIEHLVSLARDDEREREEVSLRFAILAKCLEQK